MTSYYLTAMRFQKFATSDINAHHRRDDILITFRKASIIYLSDFNYNREKATCVPNIFLLLTSRLMTCNARDYVHAVHGIQCGLYYRYAD